MTYTQLPDWYEPLDIAASVQDDCYVLLYSGAQTSYSGRYSYLAYDLAERITASDFAKLEQKTSTNQHWYANMWFGYLGYELRHALEELPRAKPSQITMPPLQMMRFGTIWRFDHERKIVEHVSAHGNTPPPLPECAPDTPVPTIEKLKSNMTSSEYSQHVETILEAIHAGEVYQANLTRKFMGRFATAPDSFELFKALCAKSPAPYSAYLKMGTHALLSSSPELFLKIDADGSVFSRPIKGTMPRSAKPEIDQANYKQLAGSEKDKAENLMIVDLMRNDLSRSCAPGSVTSQNLFEVTSHANVHHMSTDIRGAKRGDASVLDVVKQCFPPGSMTGAPKIRAMELCSQLEEQSRGVYSGAIGFFAGDGSCELSVVIRTLILDAQTFEFQVGGGIVADSCAEAEKAETLDKASGIAKTLGISRTQLEEL